MNMKAKVQRKAQQRANARIAKVAQVRRRVNAQRLQREHHIAPRGHKGLQDRVILINVIGASISNVLLMAASYGKDVVCGLDLAFLNDAWNFLLQLVGA